MSKQKRTFALTNATFYFDAVVVVQFSAKVPKSQEYNMAHGAWRMAHGMNQVVS